jgi:hypothetical protein
MPFVMFGRRQPSSLIDQFVAVVQRVKDVSTITEPEQI